MSESVDAHENLGCGIILVVECLLWAVPCVAPVTLFPVVVLAAHVLAAVVMGAAVALYVAGLPERPPE